MPCKSDYLAASKEETDSRKFCKLLCYVYNNIGKPCPTWAVKAKDEYYGDTKKVSEAVVLLCETIRSLDEDEVDRIVYNGRNPVARELADFWDAHEKADLARLLQEDLDRNRQKKSDEEEYERLKKKLGK